MEDMAAQFTVQESGARLFSGPTEK